MRLLLAALATASLAVALALPAQASAAVEWDSEFFQAPTNLPPGTPGSPGRGMVRLLIANAGDTAMTAPPTVTLTLPSGVTVSSSSGGTSWSCTGSATVTCTTTMSPDDLGPFRYVTPPSFQGANYMNLVVDVADGTPEGTFPFSVTMTGGGGDPVTEVHQLRIGSEQLPFGPVAGSFRAGAFTQAGADDTRAGGHPHEAAASFDLNTRFVEPSGTFASYTFAITSRGDLKDVVADLPRGFVGVPTATPRCRDLGSVRAHRCPPSTQVGVATISPPASFQGRQRMFGVYNVEPGKDDPALFAFDSPVGVVLLRPVVRSDGDLGVSVHVRNIAQAEPITSSSVTFWGVPADPSHDAQRCALPNFIARACVGFDEAGVEQAPDVGSDPDLDYMPHASNAPRKPFLSNPTECSGRPVVTTMYMSSWADLPAFQPDGDPDLGDPAWVSADAAAPPVTGCDRLSFNPQIRVAPTNHAPAAPTGLDFELGIPQNDDPNGLSTAHLKDTKVVLAEGMVVNPSSADGLDACRSSQIGLVSKSPLRFTKAEPTCPLASKIGTLEVTTPLLDDPMSGDVYLAAQADNPFDSLLAIYLVVRAPGVIVKLAGHVQADPQTGRLSTTVLENPQLPFSSLRLTLKSGPRAPLTTPSNCGGAATTAAFTSWAGHSVDTFDSFAVACPGEGGGFDPGFEAGVANSTAGVFSPFSMRVTRNGGKDLGRINVAMPKGALASLKHVDVCSEAQLASAAGKSGRQTQGSPACPAGSQVGTVTVGAGAGPTPFYPSLPGSNASGRVFLTGAHSSTGFHLPGARQAAYGLAVEVPAVAGPFDIGTVLVRAAIYVDPDTAEISVLSDTMPRILAGIPLNVRDVRVDIDRKNFTTTPTSCDEQRVGGDIRAQDNTPALRHSRFDVGNCEDLRFKPRLRMRLTGKRQRTTGKHPGIRAVVRQTGVGESGIDRAKVTLAKSLALDPDNAQALCEFEDGTRDDLENHCPDGSIVGRARAYSPLLKRPLVGDVYFVKNVRIDKKTGNEIRTLPMIIVALRGEVAVNLRGESSVDRKSRLVNTFDEVPDAPITRFNLNIRGGSNGILAVTATRQGRINICRGRQIAIAKMDGHNNADHNFRTRMRTPCGKKANRKAAKRKAAAKKRKAAAKRSR